jgi:hypothetical protein
MLTDDPDIIVNEDIVKEWWGKGPQLSPMQQKLSAVSGVKDPKQLAQLEQELQQFVQYRPSLKAQGDDAVIKAFVTYKKTGQMPLRSDLPVNMDQLGGKDFRENKNRRRLV